MQKLKKRKTKRKWELSSRRQKEGKEKEKRKEKKEKRKVQNNCIGFAGSVLKHTEAGRIRSGVLRHFGGAPQHIKAEALMSM